MAAVVAAAGLAAAAGLLQHMLAQGEARRQQRHEESLAREMFALKAKEEREQQARAQVAQAQQNQLGVAQRMGDNEQNAIDKLLAVFARSQR